VGVLLVGDKKLSLAKINKLQLIFLNVVDNIFRLDVSVHDSFGVNKIKRLYQNLTFKSSFMNILMVLSSKSLIWDFND
jgi:hypothetical protein